MTPAALVALLAELEADEQIAATTEAFFAPLARWSPDGESAAHRPDEFAARVRSYLDKADRLDAKDEELVLAVVRAFRSQDRPRARARWAIRGFGLFPESRAVADELLAVYLESNRVTEAFLVAGTALERWPGDEKLWRLRAKLARWDDHPEAEIEARRRLLAFEDSPELHRRIVDLCRSLGRPGDAVTHAEALARRSAKREEQMLPVLLALDAGQIDRALGLLEARALASDDPAWWRERIIEYAWQDLREDRVIRELRWLHAHDPGGGYDKRLEGVFRRRHRLPELADLLEERLARTDDPALEQELIQLRAALGQHEKARALLRKQASRPCEPLTFFGRLDLYRRSGVEGLGAIARRHAESPQLDAASVPSVLGLLEPFVADEELRAAAVTIARRFPDLPDARAFRIRLADRAADDPARAAAMAELAKEHFDDAEYVAAWAERAGWAGDLAGETAARERLVQLRGDDLANRRKLADLYEAQNRPKLSVEQWRFVAAREGIEARSQLRLIDALMAAGELEEAMAILERRARLPSASIDDRLHVANELFGKGRFDRAARFYEAVLERDEAHAEALLRLGQIRAWTNDPRGAIPYLERRLAVSTDDAATVQFILGECHWAVRQERRARSLHAAALRVLEPKTDRTPEEDVMVARMLARFGRYDEARPIFERVVGARPDKVDLALDYADAMLAVGDLAKARALVDAARARQPDYLRAHRLDGMIALREKRYDAAAEALEETIRRFGPDAGTAAELGRAHLLSGDFDAARDAFDQAHALQPANRDLENELASVEDWLAPTLHAGLSARRAGEDTAAEAWLAGSTLWKRGRTRIGASLGFAHYDGPAAVVNGGQTDVEADVLRLDVAATRRFAGMHRVGGGVEFFPGAGGNAPISPWLGLHLIGAEPYWSVRARGWWNALFHDPAAAAGLGGRTSGGALDADVSLPGRLWIGAGARYEWLSLSFDGIDPSDPRFVASTTLGWRVIDGATRVGDAHRVDSALMPGLVGARLPAVRPGDRRNALSIWANAATYRVLGDAELSSIIPLGKRFDYVTLAARYDRHVADELGFMLEGYFGRELQEGKSVYGAAAGIGWRPRRSFELAFVGAYGSALGREGDEDSFSMRLGLTWRW